MEPRPSSKKTTSATWSAGVLVSQSLPPSPLLTCKYESNDRVALRLSISLIRRQQHSDNDAGGAHARRAYEKQRLAARAVYRPHAKPGAQ